MTIGSELKSGKFTIYAQWYIYNTPKHFQTRNRYPAAILSVLFLIIFSITNFISVLPFAILAWVEAFFMIWLEIPLLTVCCPGGPKIDAFQKFFQNTLFRSILYAVFAVLIWLSILMSATSLLVAAISLSFTCIFYFISVIRREELSRSGVTGGQGVAAGARTMV
ncbi:Golgi apparatus membrane protein tvp18 [Geranomyces variabilis]|nr:Golgi apparatus membrane protein tvp18 [Geranomyces variabilis]